MTRITSLLAALALAGGPAIAQSNNPAWLDQLKSEIATAKSCDVTLFINIRESELGGRRLYEARVQCTDGRMFDASRQEPDPHFNFQACEVQVCQNAASSDAKTGGKS
jgi:hypothetical protein